MASTTGRLAINRDITALVDGLSITFYKMSTVERIGRVVRHIGPCISGQRFNARLIQAPLYLLLDHHLLLLILTEFLSSLERVKYPIPRPYLLFAVFYAPQDVAARKSYEDACQELHAHLKKELVDGYVPSALELRRVSLRCALYV